MFFQKLFNFADRRRKNAYLNGELDEEVFIEVLKFVSAPHGTVFKLKKAIYGLKESALIWNRKIDEILKDLGFYRSINNFCLYSLKVKTRQRRALF